MYKVLDESIPFKYADVGVKRKYMKTAKEKHVGVNINSSVITFLKGFELKKISNLPAIDKENPVKISKERINIFTSSCSDSVQKKKNSSDKISDMMTLI